MTILTFAPRPSPGTQGAPYLATTNCFKVTIVRKLLYYHYHDVPPQLSFQTVTILSVSNKREIKNKARRREIITKLHVHDRPVIFQPGKVVYDGKAALYTSKDLSPDREMVFELHESHTPAGQTSTSHGDMRVTLQKVAMISQSDFDSLLNERRQTDSNLTAMQILNLLCHNSTPDGFRKVTVGNKIFPTTANGKVQLRNGLEFVRGCFVSVRLACEHLLLNVDICSAIMYESSALLDVAFRLMGFANPRHLGHPKELPRLLTVLKKIRVRQVRAGKVGRVRTIREIVPRAGQYSFYLQDGSATTVQAYFRDAHNYELQYPDLPGILVIKKDRFNANADKKDVIPFELLEVVDGQLYRRRLDFDMQQRIHQLSTTHPEKRQGSIAEYLQAFSPTALASAGLQVERNPIMIQGRILPPPCIQFRNNAVTPNKGAWEISGHSERKLRVPCVLESWAVLCYESSVTQAMCERLLNGLLARMKDLGINTDNLSKGRERTVLKKENPHGNKTQHIQALLEDVRRAAKGTLGPRGFLLLVILPRGGHSSIYGQIKRLCDTTTFRIGLITQCMGWDKLGPMIEENLHKIHQYFTNLILKINVKLGGINFVPSGNALSLIHDLPMEKNTMVVGLDVSHPGPGILRPSTAGMVYSVDNFASKYFPLCSEQPPRMECIKNLRQMMVEALIRRSEHLRDVARKKYLPVHILVYRDGLSDGELANVCDEEIQAIKAAIEVIWTKAEPNVVKVPLGEVKLTYIVVGKRHHIRFFPEKGRGDKSGNCPSGFVTDASSISNPHFYDFFLQSHAGLLGTSRPAHYIVVKDDMRYSADNLQSITFGLCHTFSRSCRAVSIPAPVYYAHLICKRGEIHIEYKGDESAVSFAGSGDVEFNSDDWEFHGLNDLQKRLMYFS